MYIILLIAIFFYLSNAARVSDGLIMEYTFANQTYSGLDCNDMPTKVYPSFSSGIDLGYLELQTAAHADGCKTEFREERIGLHIRPEEIGGTDTWRVKSEKDVSEIVDHLASDNNGYTIEMWVAINNVQSAKTSLLSIIDPIVNDNPSAYDNSAEVLAETEFTDLTPNLLNSKYFAKCLDAHDDEKDWYKYDPASVRISLDESDLYMDEKSSSGAENLCVKEYGGIFNDPMNYYPDGETQPLTPYHIALTQEHLGGGFYKYYLYANGTGFPELASSGYIKAPNGLTVHSWESDHHLEIGHQFTTDNTDFDILFLSMYDRKLSGAEIQSNYDAGIPNSAPYVSDISISADEEACVPVTLDQKDWDSELYQQWTGHNFPGMILGKPALITTNKIYINNVDLNVGSLFTDAGCTSGIDVSVDDHEYTSTIYYKSNKYSHGAFDNVFSAYATDGIDNGSVKEFSIYLNPVNDPTDPPTEAPTDAATDATYEANIADDLVDETAWPEDAYTEDFTFIVPVGVHSVDVSIHTGASTFTFSVSTNAYDELEFDFNDLCDNGKDGIDFAFNGEQKASVPGLGDCAGTLSYGNDLLNALEEATTGNLWVKLSYTSTCPVYYTNLKSDFNPVLLADSSLYVVDTKPLVRINFGLPAYYYDVIASYGDQCSQEPTISSSVNVDDGCQLDYKSEINYVDHCSFALDSDATKPSDRRLLEQGYSYSGSLVISAKLDLNVAGFQVNRTVESPLNWRVWVQKTIEVSSEVEISNNNKCVDETDCNSNGCCVDGVCDCTCAEFGNGFNGDYCEEDITPPTCDLGDASITVQSNHGGCVIVSDDINANLPGFDDNSGNWYVIRNSTDAPTLTSSFPEDNNDIASNCWGIGTHKVQWHVQDVPLSDPHTENDHAFCSLTIIVEDNEDPFVDCQQCQNAEDVSATEIAICTSVLGANSFVRSVVNYDDLDQHFNDENLDANDVAYPGSVAYGGYLDCDCEYEEGGSLPAVNHITKTWDSWGNIRSWDIVDGNHQISYPDAQEDDGQYPLTYSASDDSGNSGSCGIGVTFDITAPTCDGFELTIGTDPLSKNYSLPVDFDINVSYDASISGLDQGPVLTPHRETGAQYWVGYEYNATYESIWWITDLAGNNGTCAWKVIVDNPNPCVYPTCDDAPPYVVGDCPSDVTRQCADNDGCGCGAWTNPVFADDKFVKYIDVHINGMKVDTYNNDGTTSAYDNELQFGVNHIKYIAYDMHGESAQCYWRVTMEDHVAPILDNGVTCPQTETLDTITTNADYSYSFSHNDECILNQDVTYNGGLVGGSNVTIPSGSHTLDVGIYSFRYTIRDDNNNPTYCNWDIEVADVQDPTIDCPEDISERIEQGSSYINIDWTTQASDNWQLASLTHSPNQPGDPFVAGSYTVTSTATDAAGNTSTCSFNIVITEAYPTVYFKPALAGAIVSDISAANSAPEFGATLTLATLTNVYHEVLAQPNGITALAESADNDNDQIDGTIDMISNCASDAAICEKNYEFDVIFDGCDANDKAYDLNAEVDCTPADCYEANANIEFTVSLTASNYCWQDLASVQVDAEMVTIDGADYQNIIDTYNSATFTLPSHVSVFYNQNAVAGIIHVTSDQVLTKKINIDSVKSEWFASNTYHVDDKVDEHVDSELGSDFKTDELSGIAGWYYTESKLDLETSYFTRYTAQITIDYEFGGSSRRMLLDIDAQRQLAQSDDEAIVKDAVAETMTSGTVSTTDVSVNDAVVVVMVNNCQESNTNDENAITNAVKKYLNIDANRVDTLIEPTTEGYCLAEIILEQSNCAGSVDIFTLMNYLQDGVTDSFSSLHTTLSASDISLDSNVYFVAQTPSTTSYQAASVSSSSSTSSNTNDLAWYIYVAGGFVAGLLLVQAVFKYRSNTKADVKHLAVKSEKRYSIADLLAVTERRTSLDVGNVQLHSDF